MRRFKALAAVLACGAVVAAATGTAHAGPSTQTWDFYNCSGPAGTAASFSATREGGFGNALHLVDGSATFVVLFAYNEDLGVYNVPLITPGMTQAAVVQCSTIGPGLGFHLTVWGFLAP
jgi:hypothetical protein